MAEIIGRKQAQNELLQLYQSKKAEFAVIYGRRRVGKTYLVREFFKNKFAFYHTALSPFELENKPLQEMQLQNFILSLKRYGAEIEQKITNWMDAFDCLIHLLENKSDGEKTVVFIDELPWMDTPRSGFITSFEHFWNGWAAGKENIILIVCGSATSWISDKLLDNKGGLYGRTTFEMHLAPFTLSECKDYYEYNGIVMDLYDQLQCYMIMGGIPYYMSYLKKGFSLAQNIDSLFFQKGGKLTMEFDRLYASLFSSPTDYIKVIKLLSQKREGYTRAEIAEKTGIPYGGGLTNILNALEVSDFIVRYRYYNHPKKEVYYKLIDFYSLFYLNFMEKKETNNPHFWQDNFLSPSVNAWRGLAFEEVCLAHIDKLKSALGISAVQAEISPWRSRQASEGAQIDLLIERADRVINLCEMKFSVDEFAIDKSYDAVLRKKIQVFTEETKCKKSLHITLVTTYGLKPNEYSGRVQQTVTMYDLFR